MATKASRNTRNTRKSNTNAGNGRRTRGTRASASTTSISQSQDMQPSQSQAAHLIDIGIAAASAAIKAAFGIDAGAAGVTTIGAAQPSQSQSATTATGSQAQTTSRRSARKAPGRRTDPNSNMSKTREFYAENLKLPADQRLDRAAFVKAAAKKFGCSVQTANTYVSNLERETGQYKLVRRGTGSGARGRSRGGNQSQRNGTTG